MNQWKCFWNQLGNSTNLSFHTNCLNFFQKARLARIQIAKATSGAAFVSKKKAIEARIAALAQGLPLDDNGRDDLFELQHHHLLRCLERTTVRLVFSISM